MLLMRWLISVFTVCALLLPAGAAAAEYDVQAPGRVVAFGDVHGAYEDWTALLQEVGVAGLRVDPVVCWRGFLPVTPWEKETRTVGMRTRAGSSPAMGNLVTKWM